jgi:Zinc dependent phospholipase C
VPAEGIHLTALREALAAPTLDAAPRRLLVRREDAARLGALLIDLPYFHRFAGEVFRYLAGIPARPSTWGAALHEGGAVALLSALINVARSDHDDTLAAITLGLASHVAMDRALHPLVNSLARLHKAGKNHDASHREVEKFQSICFHQEYMGRDLMGTPAITGYLAIQHVRAIAEPKLSGQLREAWSAALESAPSAAELTGYGRGYRMHIRLLGSAAGKRIAPEAAKEAARPKYLHGPWGTFAAALEAAVAASVPVLNATAAALEADERDFASAHERLQRVFPPGTIDPAGDQATLTATFVPDLLLAS